MFGGSGPCWGRTNLGDLCKFDTEKEVGTDGGREGGKSFFVFVVVFVFVFLAGGGAVFGIFSHMLIYPSLPPALLPSIPSFRNGVSCPCGDRCRRRATGSLCVCTNTG